jgi:Cu/Ag efflux pump CusA
VALAIGEGAEARAPMAIATAGGMTTSTLLTLFVVPVVYALLDRLVRRAPVTDVPEAAPADLEAGGDS